MRTRLFVVSMSVVFALFAAACGGDETTNTTGDPSDGRHHPQGNGQHVAEAAACDALVQAQQSRFTALSCVGTTRSCPDFLRAEFTTACMEYDQGSVQGCVDYYAEATACDDLTKRIADCVVTPFRGTEPKGCP